MLRLSGWTVGYVIANQIALWVVLVLANGKTRRRVRLSRGVRLLPTPARTLRGVDHDHGAARSSRPRWPAATGRRCGTGSPAGCASSSRSIIPAAGLYVGLARPIVVALLQRGAFSAHDASLVADTLVGFAVGLPAFSAYLYVLRGYYSLHDTRTPFFLNCFENAVNIGLALALYPAFGIPGLAWAFSGAYTVAALADHGRRSAAGSVASADARSGRRSVRVSVVGPGGGRRDLGRRPRHRLGAPGIGDRGHRRRAPGRVSS